MIKLILTRAHPSTEGIRSKISICIFYSSLVSIQDTISDTLYGARYFHNKRNKIDRISKP